MVWRVQPLKLLLVFLVLAGVITTVDAVTGVATLAREPVSAIQVAVADGILVTKSDMALSDPAALSDRLDQLNPHAPRHIVLHGKIAAERVLGMRVALPRADARFGLPSPGNGTHADDIVTYAIVRHSPIWAVTLTLFLEALAEHCGAEILRLKGLIDIAEAPGRPAIVHGVQHVFHPLDWLDQWPSGDRRSRIVIITRSVPKAWVEAMLDAIAAEVDDIRGQTPGPRA